MLTDQQRPLPSSSHLGLRGRAQGKLDGIDRRGLIILLCLLPLVTWFYWWTASSSIQPYTLRGDFYNLLSDAFLAGQLHLLEEPRPELLALPDPFDPAANAPYRLHDAVLYQGKYYVYHGPTPALTLFLPWKMITGKHLPENLGVTIFAVAGFVFSAFVWLELSRRLGVPMTSAWLLVTLWSLAFCQSVPFLLRRPAFYEAAIAAAFCFSMAGFAALLTGLRGRGWLLFAVAGLLFGLAVGARPHMVLVGAVAVMFLALCVWSGEANLRQAAAFVIPLVACGLGLAAYNYARFGKVSEFGVAYLLSGAADTRGVHLSLWNAIPGVYFLLLHPPDLIGHFPFVLINGRPRLPLTLPPKFFVEGVTGYLAVLPLAILGILAPLIARSRAVVMIAVSAVAVIAFIAVTGWATQRYEVDFAPMLLIATLAAAAAWRSRLRDATARRVFDGVLVASIVYATFVNVAISINGPENTMRRGNPAGYERLYRFFHGSRPL